MNLARALVRLHYSNLNSFLGFCTAGVRTKKLSLSGCQDLPGQTQPTPRCGFTMAILIVFWDSVRPGFVRRNSHYLAVKIYLDKPSLHQGAASLWQSKWFSGILCGQGSYEETLTVWM
jgi:hypothetical protein